MKDNKKLLGIAERELAEYHDEEGKENLIETIRSARAEEKPPRRKLAWKRYVFAAAAVVLVAGLSVLFAKTTFSAQKHGASLENAASIDEGDASIDKSYNGGASLSGDGAATETVSVADINAELGFLRLELGGNATAERFFNESGTLFYGIKEYGENRKLEIFVSADGTFDRSFTSSPYEREDEIDGFPVYYTETTTEQSGVTTVKTVGEISTAKEKIYFSYEQSSSSSDYTPALEGSVAIGRLKYIINIKN